MITGTWEVARISASTSNPDRSGMFTSKRTSWGSWATNWVMAWEPSRAAITWWPRLRKNFSNKARARGSDRKSTRLNSSHVKISYAVFCLKKKTKTLDQMDHIHQQRQSKRDRK